MQFREGCSCERHPCIGRKTRWLGERRARTRQWQYLRKHEVTTFLDTGARCTPLRCLRVRLAGDVPRRAFLDDIAAIMDAGSDVIITTPNDFAVDLNAEGDGYCKWLAPHGINMH
jgi:hypothetical protein